MGISTGLGDETSFGIEALQEFVMRSNVSTLQERAAVSHSLENFALPVAQVIAANHIDLADSFKRLCPRRK